VAVVIVDEAEGVVVVFGGKTEGVVGGEGVVSNGGGGDGAGNGAEGGIVIVCCDAIARLKVNELTRRLTFRSILFSYPHAWNLN
jgi:hypothetical protein